MKFESFTAEDICRILIASKGTNAQEIKCGSLQILFHTEVPQKLLRETEPPTLAGQPKEPEEEPGEVILNNELSEIIEEIAQENFMIQDPAAYERAIMDERVFGGDQGEPSGRGPEARGS